MAFVMENHLPHFTILIHPFHALPILHHILVTFLTFQKEQYERPALSQPQLLLASCLFPSILKVAFPPFFFCVVHYPWMPSECHVPIGLLFFVVGCCSMLVSAVGFC